MSFQPRIVVPDFGDLGIVVVALVKYSHWVACAGMQSGDYVAMIQDQKSIVELLECLTDQMHGEAATKIFGAVPSDEGIAEALEKFGEEFGNDPEL